MARDYRWGVLVFLHWPFCVYIAVCASSVVAGDEFDSDYGTPADSQDDEDRAILVSQFICGITAGFATLTDLIDLAILAYGETRRIAALKSSRNNVPQNVADVKPSPRGGYWVVSLRFIMICLWITAFVWGSVPTNVLMYIGSDPDDDIFVEDPPNYSNNILGFMGFALFVDVLSFAAPLIQRCFVYFGPRAGRFGAKRGAGNQLTDGHKEIRSWRLEQIKSTGSAPIGHTRSVEEV